MCAHPARNGYLLAAAAAVGWDKDREIIRFPYGCAAWNPVHGDPADLLVILWATWHEEQSWPRLTGVVEEVYDVSGTTCHDESGCLTQKPSSFRYAPVELATRWPDEPMTGEVGHRTITGSVVGLRVTSVSEPTEADVRALREKRDRGRRTVHVLGPPEVFGADVPRVGDRIAVDLSDPRLTLNGDVIGTGVVTGVALQVSRTVQEGLFTAFLPLDPEAPVPAELFVQLLCDSEPG